MKRYIHYIKSVIDISSEDPLELYRLARTQPTRKGVLYKLAESDEPAIRQEVAKNPNAPADLLLRLATDENYGVRQYVVENKNTPVEALALLANDSNRSIREYVALNPRLPEDIMEKFGENICFLVACETEDKRENLPASDTWKIRKQEFLAELCEAPAYAKIISMCDKVSNLRDTAADYKKIGDKVFERFNQKDKSEHKWYYEEILNRLEEFRELSIYKEFATLCKTVFG